MKPFLSQPIWELVDLIKEVQRVGMKVAEIGVYDGSTTRAYIEIIKANRGHLYCIDTFKGNVISEEFLKANPSYGGNPHIFGPHNDTLYSEFMERFQPYSQMMSVLQGKSHDMVQYLPDDLDVCFIDADHTYEAVKKDIDLCIHKVCSGGVLCGHDCDNFDYVDSFTPDELKCDTVKRKGNMVHAGVIQAVYERFGKARLSQTFWEVKLHRIPIDMALSRGFIPDENGFFKYQP